MIEVVVSAILGAIVGSSLTIFGSYVQVRMNRLEERRTIGRDEMRILWERLHEGHRKILMSNIASADRRAEFESHVLELSGRVSQILMVSFPGNGFGPRLLDVSRILEGVAYDRNRRAEDLLPMAHDIIVHAQWVCAAYLMQNPLPVEPPWLPEYRELFAHE